MAKLYIGCSGFSYHHWRGTFYPEDIPVKQWFNYYSKQFSTVELNVTTGASMQVNGSLPLVPSPGGGGLGRGNPASSSPEAAGFPPPSLPPLGGGELVSIRKRNMLNLL